MTRRELAGTTAIVSTAATAFAQQGGAMFGMIAKLTALPGKRDAVIQDLLAGVGDMHGCINYIVARDANDADAIWVTEVWDSKASHDASFTLPAVKESMAKVKPNLASFSAQATTVPVGGPGIPSQASG